MLSQSASAKKQGQVQGVNQSLHSLYEIFVPSATGLVYQYSPITIYIIHFFNDYNFCLLL